MDNLIKKYQTEIRQSAQKRLKLKNPMSAPSLQKIVVNMGVRDAVSDKKNIQRAQEAMVKITGQKPRIAKSKKSIATFKLREGDAIGVMVTLRGKRMYLFLDKLINIVLPRLRDFHGVKRTSFDGRGNYSIGFSEYAVFPEIDPGAVEKAQGFEVTIQIKAKNNEEGLVLLEEAGMPFKKEEKAA